MIDRGINQIQQLVVRLLFGIQNFLRNIVYLYHCWLLVILEITDFDLNVLFFVFNFDHINFLFDFFSVF